MRTTRLAIGSLTCLLLLIGCARAINRSAERRIRDALPDILGPARQYRVHVANAPDRTLRGHLSDVTIDGEDVQLSNGLLLDNLHLDLQGVTVDTQHKQVRDIRETHFTATVGEASLDEYLAGETPDEEKIQNIRVKFLANNLVTISAERKTFGLGVPFTLTGPLEIATAQRLAIDARHLSVIGIPLSGRPLQFLKGRFESGIDLSRLPFPIQLAAVQTRPGKLTLSGTADVSALLHNAQERQP